MLLSIDPLADLAEHKEQLYERLLELTPPPSEDLEALWQLARQTIDSALERNRLRKRRRWSGMRSFSCWSSAA